MSTLSTLLGLALLASPGEATEKPPRLTCESGTRYIELDASRPGQVPEVCIRPALTTTMLFDAELARVEVEALELLSDNYTSPSTTTTPPHPE